MPVSMDRTATSAVDVLSENLALASFESTCDANEYDVTFLAELMHNPIVLGLVKAHDALEEATNKPISCDNIELVRDMADDLAVQAGKNTTAKELRNILKNPHFKALIEAHDDVASKNYEVLPADFPMYAPPPQLLPEQQQTNAIKMVGIRKNANEPLGITVRSEESGLVIARILKGSMIDRQGLLHIGDIIQEINGNEVTNPDQLQEMLKKSNGNLTLKIIPNSMDQNNFAEVFYKAHFRYDPKRDNLIPCREAGLAFKEGDILQVVNMDDTNWWQARRVDLTESVINQPANTVPKWKEAPTGLVPSQHLEEKRKAFVRPEFDYTHKSLLCGMVTKKKRKMMYQTKMNAEFDRTDLLIYEEVAPMPPFQRNVIVLIGAQGVGRRTLKQRLIKADKEHFGAAIPHTTREKKVVPYLDSSKGTTTRSVKEEVNGEDFWFVSHEDMVKDIASNQFLEYGVHEDNYYGTKYDEIRRVIRSGRMCILDVSPQAAKLIKTLEFKPFIVFIGAPSVDIMRNMYEFARMKGKCEKIKSEADFRKTLSESASIERQFKQYFDFVLVNDNLDETYSRLCRAIESLSTTTQWVPLTWVY